MQCVKPLKAWQNTDGKIVFDEGPDNLRPLDLPCGQCIGCRLERSRMWALRCMNEAACHDSNCFITLTYSDDHIQTSLNYRDFQLFMKRLRKYFSPTGIRFFMGAEYGSLTDRPHYHACLFGIDFRHDRVPIGKELYRSPTLERLWPFGFSSIGDVSLASAQYIAKYCVKKVTGDSAEDFYKRVDIYTGEIIDVKPEFGRMSLKPGIGMTWLRRYFMDIINSGCVMDHEIRLGIPKYYKEYLKLRVPILYAEMETDKINKGKEMEYNNTEERRKAREVILKARQSLKKVTL